MGGMDPAEIKEENTLYAVVGTSRGPDYLPAVPFENLHREIDFRNTQGVLVIKDGSGEYQIRPQGISAEDEIRIGQRWPCLHDDPVFEQLFPHQSGLRDRKDLIPDQLVDELQRHDLSRVSPLTQVQERDYRYLTIYVTSKVQKMKSE